MFELALRNKTIEPIVGPLMAKQSTASYRFARIRRPVVPFRGSTRFPEKLDSITPNFTASITQDRGHHTAKRRGHHPAFSTDHGLVLCHA